MNTAIGAPGSAARQWADELAAWAIDPEILAAAPESPYGFPPEIFAANNNHHQPSPLHDLATEALQPGGTVLDIGAGAGAASLSVVPDGGHLHAVDSQPSMLRALETAARERNIALTTYDGAWPDIAADVPACDVVVCGHVFYNIPDLLPFVDAMTGHARHRVVTELTARHPLVRLAPMWQEVHRQPRPEGPTAELAVEVLREAGIDPEVRDQERLAVVRTGALLDAWIDFTRRQLCLPKERRPEVEDLMERYPTTSRRIVVLAWPGTAH